MDKISWKEEIKFRVVSWAIWATATLFARLARFEVIGEEIILERWNAGLPNLIATWHGRSLMPIWWFGPRRWSALISLSQDGEFQNRIFRRFKWSVVRGSSGRGGARALAAAVKQLRKGATFAITPDGPRGPSHLVHPGVLFMSQKANCPIYPMGVSSYPRWFLPTWDRYQILKPFARSIILYGEPLWVPAGATQIEMDELAAELARRICALETEADARVAPKAYREVSIPICPEDVQSPPQETPAEDLKDNS